MIVKQIDRKEASELFSKGIDVLVMVPSLRDSREWKDYMPDTLGDLLEGVMFFRAEPAMENELLGGERMKIRETKETRESSAGAALRAASRPPEEVINFRKALKLMCVICRVRVLGKVTVVDEKGRRW